MAVILNGTSQSLYVDPQVTTISGGVPFWVSMWIKCPRTIMAGVIFSSGNTGSSENHFIQLDKRQALVQTSATSIATARSDDCIWDTSWQNIIGVWAANNDRRVYINGGSKITDTTSKTPSFSGGQRTYIGDLVNSSGGAYLLSGRVAKVCIGTGTLTDQQCANIANGSLDPSTLGSCTNYWPLTSDGTDSIGDDDLTGVGSPTFDADDIPSLPVQPTRAELRNWIFKLGSDVLPSYTPTITTDAGTTPFSVRANLKQVDHLDITIDGESTNSLTTRSWLHKPNLNDKNHLVILHQGHNVSEGAVGFNEAADSLLKEGYTVLGMPMPGYGSSGQSGSADNVDHNLLASELTATFNPVEYFVGPVVAALNSLAGTYSKISMTGLSGGGWTTATAGAIDPRINHALIPIRGTTAHRRFLLTANPDWEASVEALKYGHEFYYYLMSSNSRRVTFVHHEIDTCCHAKLDTSGSGGGSGAYRDATDYDTTFLAPIRTAQSNSNVQFIEDQGAGSHALTSWVLTNILHVEFAEPATVFSGTVPFLNGYIKRKKITIDNTYVDAALYNFPLFVRVSADSDIGSNIDDNGLNIRFTEADGETLLYYDRETFSVDGGDASGEFWVRVPEILALENTHIYIYYKSTSPSEGENKTSTWAGIPYKLVSHLQEDPSSGAPQMLDATSNNHDGTSFGSMTSGDSVSGKVGNGLDFDGSDDYISFGDSDDFTQPLGFTATIIANRTSGDGPLFDKYQVGGLELEFGWSGSSLYAWVYDNTESVVVGRLVSNSDTGAFHIYKMVYNGDGAVGGASSVKIYRDGIQIDTTDFSANGFVTIRNTSTVLSIARASAGVNGPLLGILDEVRFSASADSAWWTKFEYRNIFEADNEISLGIQEIGNPYYPAIIEIRRRLTKIR